MFSAPLMANTQQPTQRHCALSNTPMREYLFLDTVSLVRELYIEEEA